MPWLILEGVIVGHFLLAEDYLEVVWREDTESEQTKNENLLLLIIARYEFALPMTCTILNLTALLAEVEYFTQGLLFHLRVLGDDGFNLVFLLKYILLNYH